MRIAVAAHGVERFDPSGDERAWLSVIVDQPNRVLLHTDAVLLPRRRAWTAWNCITSGQ